jgi:Rab3 GTPase-activating protein catalytic subunit
LFYSNVPIFIRVQQEWRNMFIGLCEGSGLRTHFNICHLKNAPHQYRHLAGLLEIFKSKLVYNKFYFLLNYFNYS